MHPNRAKLLRCNVRNFRLNLDEWRVRQNLKSVKIMLLTTLNINNVKNKSLEKGYFSRRLSTI